MLQEFSLSDAQTKMFGKPIFGADSIKYTRKRERKLHFGNGSAKAISHSKGNYDFSGTFTLRSFEIISIVKALGKEDILDLPPADIIITFANKQVSGVFNITLKGVVFTESPLEVKTGEAITPVAINFICQDIIEA